MKAVSTATTHLSALPDGRVQFRVEHDLIRGVTPEMLMWFYDNFPTAEVEVGGVIYPLYRIWHPSDHISLDVISPSPSGRPGLSPGAKVHIREFVGDVVLDVKGTIDRRDPSGTRLMRFLGPLEFGRLEHDFQATGEGVRVISTGTLGSTAPVLGSLINFAARRFASEARMKPMFRHMIEEFGNFEFFLRELWLQRDVEILRLQARPIAAQQGVEPDGSSPDKTDTGLSGT